VCAFVAKAQAPVWVGAFVIALLQGLEPGLVQPPAAPSLRTIQSTSSVVEILSCLLPQSSVGLVATSISACHSSTHGRATLGGVYVLSRCHGILPIYKPPAHSVKESRSSLRTSAASASVGYPRIPPGKSITRPGQRLRLLRASANSGDAS